MSTPKKSSSGVKPQETSALKAHERAMELFREAPSSEYKNLVFTDHIEKHSKLSFETMVNESGHVWDTLPDSVIGTLIYFILVEDNNASLRPLETLYYIFLVGVPVYFTFFLQADIVYELYLFLGTTNVSYEHAFLRYIYYALYMSLKSLLPIFTSYLNLLYSLGRAIVGHRQRCCW